VIRESLAQSEFVTNWESGGETEGGDGVTVARIARE
jgi:dsDNA-specific endonuclease/ATPase MutS2